MATAREDRFVENEKLFRTANEGLRERVEGIVGSVDPFSCASA
jgi:hypothetical protein